MGKTIVEFKQYILRKLGYPVHSVEITDEQLEDAIYEAVQRFTERHYDSVIMGLYKLQLIEGQSSYQLPEEIKTVINVFPGNNIFSSMSNVENMMIPIMPMPYQDYLWKLSSVDSLVSWRMTVKQWEDAVSNQNLIFDWNQSMHRFTLLGDLQRITAQYPSSGSFWLLVYESPDEEVEDLYDNRWLKQYAVALAKKQWGINVFKYGSSPLPGGAEINYNDIISMANDEIDKLEEQLEEFELPPSFLIG